MKVRILGCGTSSGVPRIGNDWGACDPSEPRNRRTRVSILVEHEGTRILVDTGPDMREQLLAAGVATVDAVVWTHDHADHCHGIDDLRQVFHARGSAVPCLAGDATAAILRQRFGYIFEGKGGYPSVATLSPLLPDQRIGGMRMRMVDQPHGDIVSAGLRFDAAGASIGYSTDFHAMTDDMLRLFAGIDVWIVDALRKRPHPSHPTIGQSLEWIARVRPGRAVLTHMDQSMDYRSLLAELPAGVEPAYDGLEIEL